eukprot:scaffold35185_cov62-Phaeocystis_antarctica.AAC.3
MRHPVISLGHPHGHPHPPTPIRPHTRRPAHGAEIGWPSLTAQACPRAAQPLRGASRPPAIGVLPHVEREQWHHALLHRGRVLVGSRGDAQPLLAHVIHEPCPARAEDLEGRQRECLLEARHATVGPH